MTNNKDIPHLKEDRYKGRILEVSENGSGKQRVVLGLANKVRVHYANGEVEEIEKLPYLPSRTLRLISYTARIGLELGGNEEYKFERGEVFRFNGNLLEKLIKEIGKRVGRKVTQIEIMGEEAADGKDYLIR